MSELEKVSDERLENLISRAEYEKPRLVIWDERDEERLLIAKELRKLRKSDSEALVRELATVLDECEFADNSGQEYNPECPSCGGKVHKSGCKLSELLNRPSVRRIMEAK